MQPSRPPLLHRVHDYFFPHERNEYRPHFFSLVSVGTLVVLLLLLEAAYVAQIKFVFLNTNFLASVLPGVLVDLTNETRSAHDASPVVRNAVLDTAAQAAADDMAAKGYFAHVSPDGKTPWYWLDQAGYRYRYAGENLAVNFTDSNAVQSAWLASPTHYANIVKPEYTQVGFGTANGMYEGQETTFVVEFFATPATSSAPVVPQKVTESSPAPAPVVVASGAVAAATTAPAVLGTENTPASTETPTTPVVSSASWLDRLLASPSSTVEAILAAILVFIALIFAVAVMVKTRVQHTSVLVGGAVLLVIIVASIVLDAELVHRVAVPTDAQPASISAAFGN